MTKLRSPLKTILNPMFAMTAAGLLLAGCNASGTTEVQMQSSSSSSTDAMMQTTSSSSSMTDTPAMSSSEQASSEYKDGIYSADGAYRSPAGGESVHVTLTLKGDKVTDATFKGDATNQKSILMQTNFAAGFKEVVVGKPLDDVSVTVVNGSSLTGAGFMDAVAKIKAEAKA